MLDLERIRNKFLVRGQLSTHFDKCEYEHWDCAIFALIEEVESNRFYIKCLEHKLLGGKEETQPLTDVPKCETMGRWDDKCDFSDHCNDDKLLGC